MAHAIPEQAPRPAPAAVAAGAPTAGEPVPPMATLVSYNVNGLRAILQRLPACGGGDLMARFLSKLAADVVCVQETKLTQSDVRALPHLLIPQDWDAAFAFNRSRWGRAASVFGYSGVATYWRQGSALAAVAAEEGLTGAAPSQIEGEPPQRICYPRDEIEARFTPAQRAVIDEGGRALITDHGELVVINMYVHVRLSKDQDVASDPKLLLLAALRVRVAALLAAGRDVLVMGDLNTCTDMMDQGAEWMARPSEEAQAAFYRARADRRALFSLTQRGGGPLLDVLRHFYPETLQRQQLRQGRFNKHQPPGGQRLRPPFTVWQPAKGNVYHNVRNDRAASRVDYILAGSCSPAPSGRTPLCERLRGCTVHRTFQGSDHAPMGVTLQLEAGAPPPGISPAAPRGSPRQSVRALSQHHGRTVLQHLLDGSAVLAQAQELQPPKEQEVPAEEVMGYELPPRTAKQKADKAQAADPWQTPPRHWETEDEGPG